VCRMVATAGQVTLKSLIRIATQPLRVRTCSCRALAPPPSRLA
jgi:hypothetical protein